MSPPRRAATAALVCVVCGQEDEAVWTPNMSMAYRLGWSERRDGDWLCVRCTFDRRCAERRALRRADHLRGAPVRRRAERGRRFWERYADGDSMGVIAEAEGLTRERVRQVLERDYGSGLLGLARFRLRARKRLREYVNEPEQVTLTCTVCGVVTRSVATTKYIPDFSMCRDHKGWRTHVMYVLDENRRRRHAEYPANAKRVTDRKWMSDRPRRWLNPGGAFYALCIEAREEGWPLLDRLPPEIREQLDREAGDVGVTPS